MVPREPSLPAWQWKLYPDGHRDRRNLLVHALSVPVFMAGTLVALSALVTGWVYVLLGFAMMVSAIALQGRTHKLEQTAPVPFAGPLDVLGRIFVEQWVTFPRFVLSGGFGRAWRQRG